jgi:hypothetical protein
VQDVVQELAWGYRPVFDITANNTESVSRNCNNKALLQPGTAYGLWYRAIDNYGKSTQLYLSEVTVK